MKTKQQGFGVVEIILMIVLLGAIVFVVWFVWQANTQKTDTTQSANTSTNTSQQSSTPTETKTLTVGAYKVAYPLNENNKKVIVEADNDISYEPITAYFASQNDATADCKAWIAGRLYVGKTSELLTTPYGSTESAASMQTKINQLIQEGDAAKLSDDVYALAPIKQNETCTQTFEDNEATLKKAVEEKDAIETAWLKTMKLAE
jgi:hypothetical protein